MDIISANHGNFFITPKSLIFSIKYKSFFVEIWVSNTAPVLLAFGINIFKEVNAS